MNTVARQCYNHGSPLAERIIVVAIFGGLMGLAISGVRGFVDGASGTAVRATEIYSEIE